jgi:deazaflavin-dependent oxidoreductase (nitroreductase family)
MAKKYEVNRTVKNVNRLMTLMVKLGIAPKGTHLLTVRGRKSGKRYTNPVTLIQEGQQRWLVAPYGKVNWVQNARVAGEVTLQRGRMVETVKIKELPLGKRGPILKKYVAIEPITRPYFEAGPKDPPERFEAEAARHPVFELESAKA